MICVYAGAKSDFIHFPITQHQNQTKHNITFLPHKIGELALNE